MLEYGSVAINMEDFNLDIKDFHVEMWLNKYENDCKYNLSDTFPHRLTAGELLKLTKDSIDWDRQQITGIGLKTKTRKENDIVFPDMLVAVLRDLCERTTSRKGYLVGMNKDKFYA